jgi:hypothetical protein
MCTKNDPGSWAQWKAKELLRKSDSNLSRMFYLSNKVPETFKVWKDYFHTEHRGGRFLQNGNAYVPHYTQREDKLT